MIISPLRAGAALGVFVALYHLAWSVFVAAGWAQTVINFILWIHFIRVPVQVQPFDIRLAGTLVVVTGALGFLLGAILATIWNWLQQGTLPHENATD